MKKTYLIIQLFVFSATLIAQANNNLKIQKQLVALNTHWSEMKNDVEIPLVRNLSEQELIQLHLSLVEEKLRADPPLHLDEKQLANRNTCLDSLHDYWKKGIFPTNLYHVERTPYFVDDFGVACAVGQLLLATDNEELVETINKNNNYAYIQTLDEEYDEIGIWANEFGFEVAELAWIQPCYCGDIEPGQTINVTCYQGNDGAFSPPIDSSWPEPYLIGYFHWREAVQDFIPLWCDGCDLPAGLYKGEVIDSTGTIHESFHTITEPDSTETYVAVTIGLDDGSCNGSASIEYLGVEEEGGVIWEINGEPGHSIENVCAGTYIYNFWHSCGYAESGEVTIELTTDIKEANLLDYRFYPNPTKKNLVVESPDYTKNDLTISILQTNGQLLFSKKLNEDRLQIDLSGYTDGVYFLLIENGEQSQIEKIVKSSF